MSIFIAFNTVNTPPKQRNQNLSTYNMFLGSLNLIWQFFLFNIEFSVYSSALAQSNLYFINSIPVYSINVVSRGKFIENV